MNRLENKSESPVKIIEDNYKDKKLFDDLRKIGDFHSRSTKASTPPKFLRELKIKDNSINFISFKNSEKEGSLKIKNERRIKHLKQVLKEKTDHLSKVIKNFND